MSALAGTVLNVMLLHYYEHKGPWQIKYEIHYKDILIDQLDIITSVNTLIQDGYIQDVAPGASRIPVCFITGSGRVFHEQGGYQDNTTKFDKMVKWAKNNAFVVWLLIGFTVLAALVGITASIISIYGSIFN